MTEERIRWLDSMDIHAVDDNDSIGFRINFADITDLGPNERYSQEDVVEGLYVVCSRAQARVLVELFEKAIRLTDRAEKQKYGEKPN